jgi:hypothetical protein
VKVCPPTIVELVSSHVTTTPSRRLESQRCFKKGLIKTKKLLNYLVNVHTEKKKKKKKF